MCSHLATERAGRGTLHLTVGASELYPNLRREIIEQGSRLREEEVI